MDDYGAKDWHPWDNSPYNAPALSHKASTISTVSAMTSRPNLNHKDSNVSAFSSYSGDAGHRDSVVSEPSPEQSPYNDSVDISHIQFSSLEGPGYRPASTSSIKSLERAQVGLPDALRVGSPVTPSSRGFNPFGRSSDPSYTPVSSTESSRRPSISSRNSNSRRKSSLRRPSLLGGRHESIPENEEYDLSLLPSAMPMGISFTQPRTEYATVHEEDIEDVPMDIPMDLSGFDGPPFEGPPQTEEQRLEAIRKEKEGHLTGGLGQGWTADAVITTTETDLLMAKSPRTARAPSISRRLSTLRSPRLARSSTFRQMAQDEANKRGKIVEVIVEEPKDDEERVMRDLSLMEGSSASMIGFDYMAPTSRGMGKDTVPAKAEVFFPQADWKPFSMRWPYLTALIILSVTLAAAQEYLLQKSMKEPLYKFHSASDLKTWDYFSFKYLPTMIAVSYGILWQVTDFEVKRLEPYFQLSKNEGALAAESINVDYITFFNFLRPLKALRLKHYAVAVSSLATLIAVSLVPTLQSASIKLLPNRADREKNHNGEKMIRLDPIWSRFLSVLLLFIAMFGCVLVWQLQKRKSGLVADVKGIAGIAAMANRSHILMDFKDMDTAQPNAIHKRLKMHRYVLRNSSLAPDPTNPLTAEEKDKYDSDQEKKSENPHPLMLRLIFGIPFVLGMLLFMIGVPIILFQKNANIITDKAPWLLTVLAVGIKLAWGTLETDVRMIEPFYILSLRHASPKVLTLDYTAMAFGWLPIRAFMNGHFLVALVGLGSVLAEILTICASSFGSVSGMDFAKDPNGTGPKRMLLLLFARKGGDKQDGESNSINSGEETFLSFWISFGLSIAILTFLCLVATFVYSRRRHPFLPRQPNTISSVLAFIHQSKMLYDFVGTEKMDNDEMVMRLAGIGKTYGLGWFTGRDGEMHCGIDEEELASNYKHGQDGKKTNMPWNSNWQSFD